MQRYAIVGMRFRLSPDQDLSTLGVELKWMNPEEIIEESAEFYPGIAAFRCGYIPVGSCVEGSGDPYFVKMELEDSPLVRIPHDRLREDLSLPESVIELVRPHLSSFFQIARFY